MPHCNARVQLVRSEVHLISTSIYWHCKLWVTSADSSSYMFPFHICKGTSPWERRFITTGLSTVSSSNQEELSRQELTAQQAELTKK